MNRLSTRQQSREYEDQIKGRAVQSAVPNGGHYIAYRFVSGNDYYGKMENCKLVDRWIRVNDDSLCEINFKDTVQKCEAYMAFYEAL